MRQQVDRFRGSVTGKVLFIGLLVVLLLVPLLMIQGLVAERSHLKAAAQADIANLWGGAQTIGGPILVIPFRYEQYTRGLTEVVTDELYVLPEVLTIEGDAATQVLHRGLHDVPVYTASLSITGVARPATLNRADYVGLEMLWSEALFALPIADARSIRTPIRMTIGTVSAEFQPGGARVPGFGNQLVAPLAAFGLESFDTAQAFSFELSIGGTETLEFLPLGDMTTVGLESDWPSPRFTGAFLPETRDVQSTGFSARWRVLNLGRGYPSAWKRSDGIPDAQALQGFAQGELSSFGADLLVPIGIHAATMRATKYAVLFLSLTFVAFFLFEVLAALRLHALHYLSVGLANCMFYLLLLALAEHVGFGAAYAASATASVVLVGGYSAAILKAWRRAAPIIVMLVGVYAYLYVTLRAEDVALVSGAVALFGMLAAFMYLTRHVDWHAITLGEARI